MTLEGSLGAFSMLRMSNYGMSKVNQRDVAMVALKYSSGLIKLDDLKSVPYNRIWYEWYV